MKRIIFPLLVIGLLIGSVITIKATSSSENSNTSSPPTPYSITVTLAGCQDLYCLDECTTIDVVIWKMVLGSPVELDRQDYDGSCIYYFDIDEAANTEIFAGLANQSSCGVICSNNSTYVPSGGYDIELRPACQ